jgi:hypothetical protein
MGISNNQQRIEFFAGYLRLAMTSVDGFRGSNWIYPAWA